MSSYGYNEYDDIDIVDDGWNAPDAFALRRSNPQSSTIHMTQQMTTKVAPAYDGRTSFFAFEDAHSIAISRININKPYLLEL